MTASKDTSDASALRDPTGDEGALPSPPTPPVVPSSSSTGVRRSDGSAGALAARRRDQRPPANANSTRQSSLEWGSALNALTGADACEYDIRPVYLSGKSKRQVFVERPPRRRENGGDRWRHSGGTRGGTDHWHDDSHGLRKRYGRVFREETGRTPLKFMQFTLLHKIDDKEVEDKKVCLYAVDGTQDEPEVELPDQEEAQLSDSGESELTPPSATRVIDLASDGFADVALGMPRKLPPGGGAASRSVASK
eukprot:COSAG02_NODE_1884_length_10516_cov_4.173466_1_plen_250_part_10